MRILIVVNVDWFFISHRLSVAEAALREGHEVHIATSFISGAETLRAKGFFLHPIAIDRSNSNPSGLIALFVSFVRLFWKLRPDVVHLITIKPVLIGGVAARFSPVRGVLFAISGLGHVFIANGLFSSLRRQLVGIWYRVALGFRNKVIIFQNPDDKDSIISLAGVPSDQVLLIPGSGIRLSDFDPTSVADGDAIVIMVARLLRTKGVREFVEAARLLKRRGVSARFYLAGDVDFANPASISPAELEIWRNEGYVDFLGPRSDIPQLLACSSLVVLPSYREGMPKVLMEAAAAGRAIITTDVPGCRDAIEPGNTGLLVPVRDSKCLADTIGNLLEDNDKREAMGRAGRARAERLFDIDNVVQEHLKVYRLLGAAS
jgi:glycosyltransferase involved in cell wall biosynthesis